jgi:hypothetical protein
VSCPGPTARCAPFNRQLQWLVCFSFLLSAPRASAQQFSARFYPEKQDYLVGEPVIVVLEIQNTSPSDVYFHEPGCSRLRPLLFHVDNAPPKNSLELNSCVPGAEVIDCLIGTETVPAAGVYRKRFLLEGNFELNSAGTYHVRASRDLTLRDNDRFETETSKNPGVDLHIFSEFDIDLRTPAPGELEAAYDMLLKELDSEDFNDREVVASAIAQNPPPWLESKLISMADDWLLGSAAAEGLMRLATPAARAKLWDMAKTPSRPDGGQPAIQELGEIGNPEDCEPMLALARASKDYTEIEAYTMAGRICKNEAVGQLNSLIGSDDPQVLAGVAGGLSNTSSRDAVPTLIAMLLNPNQGAREDAADGLEKLTHLESNFDVEDNIAAMKTYEAWTRWWSLNGQTAQIYDPDNCAAPSPLPGTPTEPASPFSRFFRGL